MPDVPMYHDGSRELQDRFATRKLADRLADVLARDSFTGADREFIESRPPSRSSVPTAVRDAVCPLVSRRSTSLTFACQGSQDAGARDAGREFAGQRYLYGTAFGPDCRSQETV